MISFITEILKKGPVGIRYGRFKTVFGNEAEVRWKPYFNSRSWCVKIEYNVPIDEHKAIVHLIENHRPKMPKAS